MFVVLYGNMLISNDIPDGGSIRVHIFNRPISDQPT